MDYTIPAKDEGEYNSAAEDESEDENDREEPLPFDAAEHIVGRDLIEDELAEILKKDTGEQEDRRVVQRPASTSEGLWPAGTSEGLRPASSSDSLGSPADIEMGTHSSTPPGEKQQCQFVRGWVGDHLMFKYVLLASYPRPLRLCGHAIFIPYRQRVRLSKPFSMVSATEEFKLRQQMRGNALQTASNSHQCKGCKLWFPQSCC
jgi:hypothetical protein